MNVFEDLIDELKEENLLEETVTETNNAERETEAVKEKAVLDADKTFDESFAETNETHTQEASSAEVEGQINKPIETDSPIPIDSNDGEIIQNSEDLSPNVHNEADVPTALDVNPTDRAEFFRKNAAEEVGGLQLVEHIFSGIERQQKKIVPKPYDDLKVKKSLHHFLQLAGEANSADYTQAEAQLKQEIENWFAALSHRDKQISIAHLRNYCEMTKPPLSSEALLALTRFYCHSIYSEAVRSKFDLIVTRLFSKDLESAKRELVFDRNELIQHFSELRSGWEGNPLPASKEDESELLLTAFKFEDFMNEAETAESFDELIRKDFFNRLRSFKQSTGKQFFTPLVTATAIESNVRIGNRYIELLDKEREKGETEKLENKYGFIHDQVISDATSKTLKLVGLLNLKPAEPQPPAPEVSNKPAREKGKQKKEASEAALSKTRKPNFKLENEESKGFLANNKWLISLAFVVFIILGALYLRSDYFTASEKPSQDAKKVNLENSSLKDYVRDATVGNETFTATVQPAWNSLTPEKKNEILKKIQTIGIDKGFSKVNLLDASGKTVGLLTKDGIELTN